VKCFDDVKMNIRQRCRHDGAQIYHVHYIQPLVERTRDTVLTRCTLSAPYSAYFLQAASAAASSSSASVTIATANNISSRYLLVTVVLSFIISLRPSSTLSVAVSA